MYLACIIVLFLGLSLDVVGRLLALKKEDYLYLQNSAQKTLQADISWCLSFSSPQHFLVLLLCSEGSLLLK